MNTFIHPTAVVYPNVVLGNNVYIGAFCIVGAPPEYPNRRPDEPHGGVIIGDNTILHGAVTIDAATNVGSNTIIGKNCTLMKGSHCGHDVILHDNVTLSCGVKVGGYSMICDYSTIGLNATIHQKSFVPKGTMIGASSFFKGVYESEFQIFAGVPAKVVGNNWRLTEKLNNKNL